MATTWRWVARCSCESCGWRAGAVRGASEVSVVRDACGISSLSGTSGPARSERAEGSFEDHERAKLSRTTSLRTESAATRERATRARSAGVMRVQARQSGSEDAKRLPSLQEIADFLQAVRFRRNLTTSRESFALPNDFALTVDERVSEANERIGWGGSWPAVLIGVGTSAVSTTVTATVAATTNGSKA